MRCMTCGARVHTALVHPYFQFVLAAIEVRWGETQRVLTVQFLRDATECGSEVVGLLQLKYPRPSPLRGCADRGPAVSAPCAGR